MKIMTVQEMVDTVVAQIHTLAKGNEEDLQWIADIYNMSDDSSLTSHFTYNPTNNLFEKP